MMTDSGPRRISDECLKKEGNQSIRKQIGYGNFGGLFIVKDVNTNNYVVMKLQKLLNVDDYKKWVNEHVTKITE